MLAALLLITACGESTGPSGEPAPEVSADVSADAPRPNILLITLDTVRADHLPCYGYERDTAPAICELAAQGTLFRRAVSQASWTDRLNARGSDQSRSSTPSSISKPLRASTAIASS